MKLLVFILELLRVNAQTLTFYSDTQCTGDILFTSTVSNGDCVLVPVPVISAQASCATNKLLVYEPSSTPCSGAAVEFPLDKCSEAFPPYYTLDCATDPPTLTVFESSSCINEILKTEINGDECVAVVQQPRVKANCDTDQLSIYFTSDCSGSATDVFTGDSCTDEGPVSESSYQLDCGDGDGGDGDGARPCFANTTLACKASHADTTPKSAYSACFLDRGSSNVAKLVPLVEVKSGDYVLAADPSDVSIPILTRVIVSQHRKQAHLSTPVLRISYGKSKTSVMMTPDHVMLLNGLYRPARVASVGDVVFTGMANETITSITQERKGFINPVTTSGTIYVTEGDLSIPLLASTYPEWISDAMLGSSVFPTATLSNLASYLFPEIVQQYYDDHLEALFEKHTTTINRLNVPYARPFVIYILDLMLVSALPVYKIQQ